MDKDTPHRYTHRVRDRPPNNYHLATPKTWIFPTQVGSLSNDDRFTLFVASIRYAPNFYIERCAYQESDIIMASKGFDWTFVNIKLTEKDKKGLIAYIADREDTVEHVLEHLTLSGYKVSVSYSDSQKAYIATCSGTDRVPDNNKQSISSMSGNPIESIFMTGYKVEVVTKNGKWSDYEVDNIPWG